MSAVIWGAHSVDEGIYRPHLGFFINPVKHRYVRDSQAQSHSYAVGRGEHRATMRCADQSLAQRVWWLGAGVDAPDGSYPYSANLFLSLGSIA